MKVINDLQIGDTVYITDGSTFLKKETVTVKEEQTYITPTGKADGKLLHLAFSDGKELKIHKDTSLALTNKIGALYRSSIAYGSYSYVRIYTSPEEAKNVIESRFHDSEKRIRDVITAKQTELEKLFEKKKELLQETL